MNLNMFRRPKVRETENRAHTCDKIILVELMPRGVCYGIRELLNA
jgi:hypothetical protein